MKTALIPLFDLFKPLLSFLQALESTPRAHGEQLYSYVSYAYKCCVLLAFFTLRGEE